MIDHNQDNADLQDEVYLLADACINETLSAEMLQRLEELVCQDPMARQYYVNFLHDAYQLHRLAVLASSTDDDQGVESEIYVEGFSADIVSAAPPLAPILGFRSDAWYGMVSYFSQVGPLSYLLAVAIMSVMLLGAWAYKITHYPQQVATTPSPSVPSSNRPELVFVGRITGMKDCRWADPKTEAVPGAYVPLGRKYALTSGLMEITYKTRAKVILQGPCNYEVESPAGGFLSLGKLTATVVSGQWSVARAKPQAANLQISKSPNLQISKFSVRTPTAVVTDLGTEFGVEVTQEGHTEARVFEGAVRVATVAGKGGENRQRVCREGESVRVDAGKSAIRTIAPGDNRAKRFVRAMPPPKSVRDSRDYAELVLSLRPAVYYRMERPKDEKNNRVVFDSAPGHHHGELRFGNEFGGSAYWPGRFGNSLWFRGPEVCDRVIVPDYPKAADDQLTVSAWVLATGQPGWAMIAANWGHPENGSDITGQFHLGLLGRDGDIHAHVTQRNGQVAQVREGVTRTFPLGVWQHVALVADGTTLHLYRNGDEVACGPCAGILPQPPVAGLGVGCKTNSAGTDVAPGDFYWKGRIDELAVFNRALSAETIRRLYLGKALPERQSETTSAGKGDEPMAP